MNLIGYNGELIGLIGIAAVVAVIGGLIECIVIGAVDAESIGYFVIGVLI